MRVSDLKDGQLFRQLAHKNIAYRRETTQDGDNSEFCAVREVLTNKPCYLLAIVEVRLVDVELKVNDILTFRELDPGAVFVDTTHNVIYVKMNGSNGEAIALDARMTNGTYCLSKFASDHLVKKIEDTELRVRGTKHIAGH